MGPRPHYDAAAVLCGDTAWVRVSDWWVQALMFVVCWGCSRQAREQCHDGGILQWQLLHGVRWLLGLLWLLVRRVSAMLSVSQPQGLSTTGSVAGKGAHMCLLPVRQASQL
jgi:hypothetical protein